LLIKIKGDANMKVMIIGLLLVALNSLAFAGESGYILNGEAVVVYKDGKQVGKMLEQQKSRTPSSVVTAGPYDVLYYQDDGNVRCYTTSIASQSTAISCVAGAARKLTR
jgi:hypothetical protein